MARRRAEGDKTERSTCTPPVAKRAWAPLSNKNATLYMVTAVAAGAAVVVAAVAGGAVAGYSLSGGSRQRLTRDPPLRVGSATRLTWVLLRWWAKGEGWGGARPRVVPPLLRLLLLLRLRLLLLLPLLLLFLQQQRSPPPPESSSETEASAGGGGAQAARSAHPSPYLHPRPNSRFRLVCKR